MEECIIPNMEPERLLIAGDVHGDPQHLMYLYETALAHNCNAIIQLGDYFYWEHHPDGWAWLDCNQDLAEQTGIPTAWLDGNHENHRLLWSKYRNAPKTPEGFWELRNGLFYMPRATRWEWRGTKFMALGGATSIDRAARLREYRANTKHMAADDPRRLHHENWWSTEDITEADVQRAIANPTPIDILLCHDKPSGVAGPGMKDHPVLLPNQERLQKVINVLKPRLVLHGHIHRRYTQEMRIGDDGLWCRVEGLAHNNAKDPRDSWEVLPLVKT